MGSIEMTDYERRQLAAQSLESNIRDENFCELFPDLTMVTFVNVSLLCYYFCCKFLFIISRQFKKKLKKEVWPEPTKCNRQTQIAANQKTIFSTLLFTTVL